MKTGIITITSGSNYGNRLQNYAMVQVLKNIGTKPENICKYHDRCKLSISIKARREIIKLLKIKSYLKVKREDRFRSFNKKYIKFSSKKCCDANFDSNAYNMVLCGSDQIWNPNYFFNKDYGCYFADFMPKEKRAAFSASIGISDIPDEYKGAFADYINSMHAISVREQRAAEIIKELTGKDVPVTIDPTLMLTAQDWLKIAKKPKYVSKNQKFVLTYFLGEFSDDTKAYVDCVAQQNNLKQINLQNDFVDNKDIINADWFVTNPGEFVWLVANCDAFVTDSFHGCVFGSIFKKPFRWFSRHGNEYDKNMNSRMETLFSKLGIGDWCIGNALEDADKIYNCDFNCVDSNLAKERQIAYDYLKGVFK